MANRYWVGGTGTWNATLTTNWSASSGGGSGASVPTAADAVIFDASSGTGTVTLSGSIVCLSYNNSAANISFSGVTTLTCSGNFTHSVATSFTSAISINATSTMTIAAGATFTSNLNVSTPGILTLASSISFDTINISSGTFNTANYNITLTNSFSCNVGAAVTTVSLGSSTIYMVGKPGGSSSTTINGAGLTLTANTATFDYSGDAYTTRIFEPSFQINSPHVINRVRMSGAKPISLLISGSGTITNFDSSLTCQSTVNLASITTITNWNASGYSSTAKLILRSITPSTTAASLIVTNNATASNLCIIALNKLAAGSFTLTNSYLVTLTSSTAVGAQLTGWTADITSSGTNRKAVVLTGTDYTDASWTVPADWASTNNEIHVIGGGGTSSGPAGTTGQSSSASGSGGGGGGYTKVSNLALTPAATVNWTAGTVGVSVILQSPWIGSTGRYGIYTGFSRTAVNTISLVGNSKTVNNGAASVTVTKPTGTTTGDLLIMFVSLNGTASVSANWYITDSGWTRQAGIATSAVAQTIVFYKYASSSEPANYTATNYAGTTATGLVGYVLSYRNALFNTAISNFTIRAAATPALYANAITPTTDGSRIISYIFSATASVTVSSVPSGQTLLDSNATATAPSTFIYTGSFNIASGAQNGSTTTSATAFNLGLVLNPTSSYTYLATGGNPGTTWIANTTASGILTSGGAGGTGSGGTLNYTGGAGGSGSGGSTQTSGNKGAGGGGGAAGPNGNGGAGGAGASATANVAIAGAGGGGNGGGSAGTAGTSASSGTAVGSNGGNNYLGSGGGTSTLVAQNGGGGAGGNGVALLTGFSGNTSSYGSDILTGVSLGSAGGGGASASSDGTSGGYGYDNLTSGGSFGGFGGGGGGSNGYPPSGPRINTAVGAPGGIIIIYGGPSEATNTSNFFFMF